MNKSSWLRNIWIRNLAGILALVAVHYVSDHDNLAQRTGFNRLSPYIFLLLMYGWIVFHNRVLFERVYMKAKKQAYFTWSVVAMLICSFNMHVILRYVFNVVNTVPQVLSFWVYTITGLGIYVIFKYLRVEEERKITTDVLPLVNEESYFTCTVDGASKRIAYSEILYVESLENYVKVITGKKSLLTRLSMKEAEERLPKPLFIRISRSHIINSTRIVSVNADVVKIRDEALKIGKVYKKYVEEQLGNIRTGVR